MGKVSALIGKREVEELLKQNPNYKPAELASMLGVGIELIYTILKQYGWMKERQRSLVPFDEISEEDLRLKLKEKPNLTLEQIAKELNTSLSQVERVKRDGQFEPLHKGRKIPMSEEKLKDKIVELITKTGMQRQEMAWELGVTPPTVGNYVKVLKKEGRVPQDFSFRKRNGER